MTPSHIRKSEKVPRFAEMSEIWHAAPRRWGHAMHSVCSYFAMFPPQVPHVFIEWLTERGDVVYDPFSGRGTAPMEACRLGRIGLGSDANPLAIALTSAKVDPPTQRGVLTRLAGLRRGCQPREPDEAPAQIRMLYHPRVLGQLLWLRDHLGDSRSDRFIRAVLLGLMHANYVPGAPARGFSISMPNTFSMSPSYVERYIREHSLLPPVVDVFDLLETKIRRLRLPPASATRGLAWEHDVRESPKREVTSRPAKLVFTSPPYLGVISYGKYNWIRLWLLGEDPKDVDSRLAATESSTRYLSFMQGALMNLHPAVRDDGYVCLVIGDVRERRTGKVINLASEVWTRAAEPAGWKLVANIPDAIPAQHKVSRIWKHGAGNATKTDRILMLTRNSRLVKGPPALRRVDWGAPTQWA